VARTYNKFEKNCVAPTVEYVLEDNNKYRVHNRCFDKVMGGEMIEYHGTATPTNEGSTFTMDITYYFIFTKEYRLLHLEEDYSAAVMADQNLEHLWIMSREPTMKKNILDKILAKLDLQIDLKRLIYSSENEKGA
jgi:apolipoprotein D and lipocalin family protein